MCEADANKGRSFGQAATTTECEATVHESSTKGQQETFYRVATAQGKQGIYMFIFPDRENTGNLPKNIKNMILHREIASYTGKILKF